MPCKFETDYDIKNFEGKDLVSEVTWTLGEGDDIQRCRATLNPKDYNTYIYESELGDDTEPKVAPKPMSLADCVLAANVHLGLIPPINFPPLFSPNQH